MYCQVTFKKNRIKPTIFCVLYGYPTVHTENGWEALCLAIFKKILQQTSISKKPFTSLEVRPIDLSSSLWGSSKSKLFTVLMLGDKSVTDLCAKQHSIRQWEVPGQPARSERAKENLETQIRGRKEICWLWDVPRMCWSNNQGTPH